MADGSDYQKWETRMQHPHDSVIEVLDRKARDAAKGGSVGRNQYVRLNRLSKTSPFSPSVPSTYLSSSSSDKVAGKAA